EVYSEITDPPVYGNSTVDVDGHYDWVGDNTTTFPSGVPDPNKPEGWFIDPMTGASYWNPRNGVNESVYFGIWHDAAAIDIDWDVTQEIEKNSGCVDIPITAHVSNEGTVAEPIPYTIEVKKTKVEFFLKDDIEKGDTDYYTNPDNWPNGNSWEIGYFDNPNCINWHITDMDYRSPTHAWYAGNEVCPDEGCGYYGPDQWNALRMPYVDISDFLSRNIPVYLSLDMTYSLDPTLNPNYKGHFSQHGDAIIFGVWDPVNNLYLHFSGTERSGYLPWTTLTVGDIFGMYGVTTLNDLYNVYASWMIGHGYSDPQGKIAIFVSFMTDGSGTGYPGMGWGGVLIDNVNIYGAGVGDTVWSMSGVTDVLEPGEQAEIHAIWHACNFSDYRPVITTHLEGDWNTKFKGNPTLGYMYNDEAIGNNIYIYTTVYEEDFEPTLYTNAGEFSSEWSTEDNTFGEPAYWTVVSNGAPGWQENHYVWTGEGEDIYDSTYAPNVDEVLVPKDPETGGILTFDWTDETAVTLSFDLWTEIENYWDYIILEVSNDSGNNWWTIYDWWATTHNTTVNVETWEHYDLTLFNLTAGASLWVYDPVDFFGSLHTMEITENMTFRFHFISDSYTGYKGAYIDNVELISHENETIPWDGTDHPWRWTQTVLFEDDFENGLDKWLNINEWTGSMWHVTDTCHYSGSYSAGNFDPYPWSSYNLHFDYSNYPFLDFIAYDHSYGYYRNNADDKLILDVDLSGVYQAWLRYMINYTLDAGDLLVVEISTDGGNTWKELIRYTPDDATNGAGWVNQTSSPTMGYEPYNYGIDITPYVGQEVKIRWRLVSNETMNNGSIQLDDVWITGKIDDEAPTTTAILDPASPDGCNGWYTSPVTVTLVATDNIAVEETYYRIDGGSWLKYTAPFTISVDGEHTIDYYSVDSVGNKETVHSVSFKIDSTAPSVSLTYPQAGYIYLMGRQLFKNPFGGTFIIGKMTFQADASDATSGVKNVHFKIGDNEYDDTTSPYEVFWHNFDLLPKKYTVTVTATDNACNSA
ncbi:MAG: hypothetical protein DRP62_07730, partial [Planctomycetota bacterium]